ncbi:MAG: DUF3105 domain-containing protein, partial [Nitrospinaceae bacterium]|nr:DUF3105 domain-containing protein [Nitrospinaceae bacterium]
MVNASNSLPKSILASPFIWLAVVIIAIGTGYVFWPSGGENKIPGGLIPGKNVTSKINTIPSAGATHLRSGEKFSYPDSYPTSGPHEDADFNTGFHKKPLPPTRIVHALEHGNIVLHYDEPSAEVMTSLRQWAVLYTNPWSGVIVTRKPGLGKSIVLTAWT